MVKNMTINYGSIMMMFVVGYTDTLTMSVPLQALRPLCADFDGRSRMKVGKVNTILIVVPIFEKICTLPSLKLLNCWKLKTIYKLQHNLKR